MTDLGITVAFEDEREFCAIYSLNNKLWEGESMELAERLIFLLDIEEIQSQYVWEDGFPETLLGLRYAEENPIPEEDET